MAVKPGVSCQACGAEEALSQCMSCKSRLSRGFQIAVCSDCKTDSRKLEAIGRFKGGSSTEEAQLHCNMCITHERQQEEERLIQAVGGPSPNELLRTIAGKMPWYLVIAKATPEEKLAAHQKLKRRLDFSSTERELFASLETESPQAAMAAFVVQQAASSGNNAAAARLVDSFVHSKVPSIKYKDLLFPPTGSFDKGRRHFVEMMKSADPLVAAMAAERDFLCNFFEGQCSPPHKKATRYSPVQMDVPHHAVQWLHGALKSLSQQYKKAAARQEAELMLIRTHYATHLMVAHSYVQ
jgi:hypothetical protein